MSPEPSGDAPPASNPRPRAIGGCFVSRKDEGGVVIRADSVTGKRYISLTITKGDIMKLTALAAVAVLALAGCSGETSATRETGRSPEGSTSAMSTPSTTPTVVCTSGAGFSYQAGACVEGSGSVNVGPFTTPGPWGVTVVLSGKSDTGEDCASLNFALVAADEVTNSASVAVGTSTGSFSISLAAQPDAVWHVRLDPPMPGQTTIAGCSWTATFS